MSGLVRNFEGVVGPDSAEYALIQQIDATNLPRHVAVIMDGNGRWARRRGLPRVEGHRAGIDAVKSIVEFAARLGIPQLTLYAFSAENWKRPIDEVNTLWSLLKEYLRREYPTIQEHHIRFRAIGRISELPESVREELLKVESDTKANERMDLLIALNYSGRLELVDAVNQLLSERVRGPIGEEDIASRLYTSGLPDPDFLIRTSGEFRISNFLLWQIAYAEIYVSEVLWPDFRGLDFLEAVVQFQKRERRYGGLESRSAETLS